MSKYKKSFPFCFLLWLLLSVTGLCQNTHGRLDVPRVAPNLLSAALTDLNSAAQDTTKARLLLKLSYIYYFQDRAKHYNTVDSAVFFAQQTMNLSSKIKFTTGIAESELVLCRRLLYLSYV